MYWPNALGYFSEMRILSDVAFTRKPIDHQNGERGTGAA